MKEYIAIARFIRELYKKPKGIIPLHAPVFDGNEKKYLNLCIDSTFVSSVGKFVDEFENKMAKYTGAKKAVACVNGTSALHLALKLSGVTPNSEVITQPLTFIATANAITYCGARPVFLDVDMDTLGLSSKALKNWLEENVELRDIKNSDKSSRFQPYNIFTNRPITACVPMHTFGFPCQIDEIIEICENYKIPVVEDAAESLGSFYKKQHTGTFGKIGVLSFNGNKIITTGGGGVLLFNDEQLAKRAKHLTTQAKVSHPWEFVHDEIGYNYRMPNVNAAIGLAQYEQLKAFLQTKRKIAASYQHFFSTHQEINLTYISEPPKTKSNYWLNCILLSSRQERDEFLKVTNKEGVMTRPAWTLMNKLQMFEDCQTDELHNSIELANRLVNLPSSTFMI